MFVILPYLFANGVGGNENGPLGHGVLRGPWKVCVCTYYRSPPKNQTVGKMCQCATPKA